MHLFLEPVNMPVEVYNPSWFYSVPNIYLYFHWTATHLHFKYLFQTEKDIRFAGSFVPHSIPFLRVAPWNFEDNILNRLLQTEFKCLFAQDIMQEPGWSELTWANTSASKRMPASVFLKHRSFSRQCSKICRIFRSGHSFASFFHIWMDCVLYQLFPRSILLRIIEFH